MSTNSADNLLPSTFQYVLAAVFFLLLWLVQFLTDRSSPSLVTCNLTSSMIMVEYYGTICISINIFIKYCFITSKYSVETYKYTNLFNCGFCVRSSTSPNQPGGYLGPVDDAVIDIHFCFMLFHKLIANFFWSGLGFSCCTQHLTLSKSPSMPKHFYLKPFFLIRGLTP